MKRLTILALAICAAMMTTACGGDTRDSLASEQLKVMNDFATTLEGVKDAGSAKAAKPKLEALATRMDDINARESKLPPATEAETKALMEKRGKDMDATMMKVQSAMMKIMMDPAIQAELKDVNMGKVAR